MGIVVDKVAIVDIVTFTAEVAVCLPNWHIAISAATQLSVDGLDDVLGEPGENRTEFFGLEEFLIRCWSWRCR
jgi:hypothetical protein